MKPNTKPIEPEEVTLETVALILIEILDTLQKTSDVDVEYYDNADMKRIFHLSDSTLHRIRKSNSVPYRKIQGKIYYPKAYFNEAFKF